MPSSIRGELWRNAHLLLSSVDYAVNDGHTRRGPEREDHGPRSRDGAKRAIELRLRLSKQARVSALLSRKGRALKRNQFSARAGASVWRLRLGGTVKPGLAKLGLTYRSSAGEIARSNHRLRLPR
jgi:hypothetical protein